MVRELQIPIIAAGAAALVAIDDLQEIPMLAGLVGPKPSDEFIYVEERRPFADQATDRQARAGLQFFPERVFYERIFLAHGDPRTEDRYRTAPDNRQERRWNKKAFVSNQLAKAIADHRPRLLFKAT
jgi:hypothetical protein